VSCAEDRLLAVTVIVNGKDESGIVSTVCVQWSLCGLLHFTCACVCVCVCVCVCIINGLGTRPGWDNLCVMKASKIDLAQLQVDYNEGNRGYYGAPELLGI